MRKIISVLLVTTFICSGCQIILDEVNTSHELINGQIDSNRDRIVALENWCDEANANISAISAIVTAINENDCVTKVDPILRDGEEIGYILTFSKSGAVTIYHGTDGNDGREGVDGQTPVIGIAKDTDGFYYWTVNGEWLLDSGDTRITAGGVNGITPQLRIFDGYWEISTDNGRSWTQKEKAVGEDGRSFFAEVEKTDSVITLTLVGGEVVAVPIYQGLSFEFNIEKDSLAACAGNVLEIQYSLNNATESTVVTASSDGNYSVQIVRESSSEGRLIVTCPEIYTDGYINVCASTESGLNYVRVINFFEGEVIFEDEDILSINSYGGEIIVPFTTNFIYSLDLSEEDASWISIISQNNEDSDLQMISLNVDENPTLEPRQGKVNIVSAYGKLPFGEIVINQSASIFTIDNENFDISYQARSLTANIRSTLGLTVRIDDNPNWVTCNTKSSSIEDFNLTFLISRNNGLRERECTVSLYDRSGTRLLGKISIKQGSRQ